MMLWVIGLIAWVGTCGGECVDVPVVANAGSLEVCAGTGDGEPCALYCLKGYNRNGELRCEGTSWSIASCNTCYNTLSEGGDCTFSDTWHCCGEETTCYEQNEHSRECLEVGTCPPLWNCVDRGIALDDCTGAPSVAHASNDLSTCVPMGSGGTCAVVCASGYHLSMPLVCTDGNWSGSVCLPDPCDEAPAPGEHGHTGSCPLPAAPSSTCSLLCDVGYQGNGDFTCIAGSWTQPECLASCEVQPEEVTHALLPSCALPEKSGNPCGMQCLNGYVKSGDWICSDGVWSTPMCNSKPCEHQPLPVDHASAPECPLPTPSGGTCEVTCDVRYTKTGNWTCDLGAWNTPACDGDPCVSQPPEVEHGQVPGCLVPVSSGNACALACDPGYGGSDDWKCTAGEWSSPTCEPLACDKQPPAVPHAAAPACALPTLSGGDCLLECNYGYEKTGNFGCHLGAWNKPVCKVLPDACISLPAEVAHAMPANCTLPAPSGTSCALHCLSAYASAVDWLCTDEGWNNPFCDVAPDACTSLPPTVAHAAAHPPACSLPVASGGSCALACAPAYTKSADWLCAETTWSTETCDVAVSSCTSLPPPVEHASAPACVLPAATGSDCELSCNTGYYVSKDWECVDGSWSDPHCEANTEMCWQQPSAVEHARAASCALPALSGATCAVECVDGYVNEEEWVCTSGAWNSPACAPSPCATQPVDVQHGLVPLCDLPVASGDSCALRCMTGYTPSDAWTCERGSWDAPTCSANPCTHQPGDIEGGFASECSLPLPSGEECALECHEGYTKISNWKCLAGDWVTPMCRSNFCADEPEHAEHGWPPSCELPTAPDEFCTLTCHAGYYPTGDWRCVDGAWQAAECLPFPCDGQPVPVANGVLPDCDTPIVSGSTCALSCVAGYTPVGVWTCAAGAWKVPMPYCQSATTGTGTSGTTTGSTTSPPVPPEGSPDPPIPVLAEAFESMVELSFIAPLNTGDSPIAEYEATGVPLHGSSGVVTSSSLTPPTFVDNAINGKTYSFSIVAVNQRGKRSIPSQPFNLVTPSLNCNTTARCVRCAGPSAHDCTMCSPGFHPAQIPGSCVDNRECTGHHCLTCVGANSADCLSCESGYTLSGSPPGRCLASSSTTGTDPANLPDLPASKGESDSAVMIAGGVVLGLCACCAMMLFVLRVIDHRVNSKENDDLESKPFHVYHSINDSPSKQTRYAAFESLDSVYEETRSDAVDTPAGEQETD